MYKRMNWRRNIVWHIYGEVDNGIGMCRRCGGVCCFISAISYIHSMPTANVSEL